MLDRWEVTIIDDYGWTIEIDDFLELLTDDIIEKLKSSFYTIFYDEDKQEYWTFKFGIDGVWFKLLKLILKMRQCG